MGGTDPFEAVEGENLNGPVFLENFESGLPVCGWHADGGTTLLICTPLHQLAEAAWFDGRVHPAAHTWFYSLLFFDSAKCDGQFR